MSRESDAGTPPAGRPSRVSRPAIVHGIGWFATLMAILMYTSFVEQILLNLSGRPGPLLLPIAATINASAWFAYGTLKAPRDWKIIFSNLPGIVLGLITTVTAIAG